jgi:hypothetical protein
MKGLLTVAALASLLGLALFAAHRTWVALEGVAISTSGLIALGLGIFLTVALGVGLMFLVFYSNRRGYDEADRSTPPDARDR